MRKEVQISQYLLSLISGSFFVLNNLIFGWGTYEAQKIAVPPFVLYNLLDIFLAKYWRTDPLLMIHHTFVIILGSYIYFLNGFTDDIYRISYFMSIGEISSIFNSLRWFYYGTEWEVSSKISFALAFLFFRPISTFGLLKALPDIEDPSSAMIIKPSAYAYTALNMYWGYLIFKKLYKYLYKICYS